MLWIGNTNLYEHWMQTWTLILNSKTVSFVVIKNCSFLPIGKNMHRWGAWNKSYCPRCQTPIETVHTNPVPRFSNHPSLPYHHGSKHGIHPPNWSTKFLSSHPNVGTTFLFLPIPTILNLYSFNSNLDGITSYKDVCTLRSEHISTNTTLQYLPVAQPPPGFLP